MVSWNLFACAREAHLKAAKAPICRCANRIPFFSVTEQQTLEFSHSSFSPEVKRNAEKQSVQTAEECECVCVCVSMQGGKMRPLCQTTPSNVGHNSASYHEF